MLFSFLINMITHAKRNELFAVLIALITITILFMNGNAYAHTNVDINSSLNINSSSKNTSTSKNTIKINGETIVDDESTDGSVKSNIEVKLENGEGTVKYTEGDDEKIIQITPKDNDSINQDEDDDIVNEDDKSKKTEINETENKEKEKDTKPRDLIEQMMRTLDSFIAKLSDLFN